MAWSLYRSEAPTASRWCIEAVGAWNVSRFGAGCCSLRERIEKCADGGSRLCRAAGLVRAGGLKSLPLSGIVRYSQDVNPRRLFTKRPDNEGHCDREFGFAISLIRDLAG